MLCLQPNRKSHRSLKKIPHYATTNSLFRVNTMCFFLVYFIYLFIMKPSRRSGKPGGKLTCLICEALTGRWTDRRTETNTWLTATLERRDSCRHVRQTDKQTGTRSRKIRHLLTERATCFSDTETDRQTSRIRTQKGGILLSLQAEFNGCSASQPIAVDGGELNVMSNFADLEIDGDRRVEKEKPQEGKKGNKGIWEIMMEYLDKSEWTWTKVRTKGKCSLRCCRSVWQKREATSHQYCSDL